jgi:hypothetical protein
VANAQPRRKEQRQEGQQRQQPRHHNDFIGNMWAILHQ